MKSVEITYSYHSSAVPPPPPPANAEAARRRLEEGNRRFAILLDQIKSGAGTDRQIMRLDPYILACFPASPTHLSNGPSRQSSAAPMPGFQSN